jgi:hypothetical protein
MGQESRWRWGVVEGGIILVGVLLAFWVDSSWERRQDRQLEDAILSAVSEEIEGNRTHIVGMIENTDARLARIDRFLATDPASAASIEQDSLVDHVIALPNVPLYLPVHSAVTMLMQTPVQDQAGIEARRLIDNYLRAWGVLEGLHEGLRASRDEVIDALAPYAARDADSGRDRINQAIARQGVHVFTELRQDERVLTAVLKKAHWQDVYRRQLRVTLETLDSVQVALGER